MSTPSQPIALMHLLHENLSAILTPRDHLIILITARQRAILFSIINNT